MLNNWEACNLASSIIQVFAPLHVLAHRKKLPQGYFQANALVSSPNQTRMFTDGL